MRFRYWLVASIALGATILLVATGPARLDRSGSTSGTDPEDDAPHRERAGMRWIPGEFWMSTDDPAGVENERAAHRVTGDNLLMPSRASLNNLRQALS